MHFVSLLKAQEASDQLINCLTHQSIKNKYIHNTEHLWQNFSKGIIVMCHMKDLWQYFPYYIQRIDDIYIDPIKMRDQPKMTLSEP